MTDRFPFAPGTVFWVSATHLEDADERARNLVGTDSVTYLAALHEADRSGDATEADSDATAPDVDEASDEDETGSLAPDETDAESGDVSDAEDGTDEDGDGADGRAHSFGLDTAGKPEMTPGTCYHALLTIVDVVSKQQDGPVTNSDCHEMYDALGFHSGSASAAMAELRDKFEMVAPVAGWPPKYVPTYRGRQYLDDYGRMEIEPEEYEDAQG